MLLMRIQRARWGHNEEEDALGSRILHRHGHSSVDVCGWDDCRALQENLQGFTETQ